MYCGVSFSISHVCLTSFFVPMVYTRHRPTIVFSGQIYSTACFCTACKLRMAFTFSYIFKWLKTNQKKDNTLWPMRMIWNSKHPRVKLCWDTVLSVCFHAQTASLRTCSKGCVTHRAPSIYYRNCVFTRFMLHTFCLFHVTRAPGSLLLSAHADGSWLCLTYGFFIFSSVQFSCSVVSDSLRPHELQHARPPYHQLPEFTHTHVHRVGDAIQPSHPLSSPFPPAPSPSQHQSLFQWVNSSHEVAKVLEFQL